MPKPWPEYLGAFLPGTPYTILLYDYYYFFYCYILCQYISPQRFKLHHSALPSANALLARRVEQPLRRRWPGDSEPRKRHGFSGLSLKIWGGEQSVNDSGAFFLIEA